MAQISYRANLSAVTFPLALSKAGRSVVVPGPDQNFDKRIDPAGEQGDPGIPQVLYAENVIPTAHGYQSVGYIDISTIPLLGRTVVAIRRLPSRNSGTTVVSYYTIVFFTDATAVSKSDAENQWRDVVTVGVAVPATTESAITNALVRGVSYLHKRNLGLTVFYTISDLASIVTITDVTATITPAGFENGVLGICSSFNYMIVVKTLAIHWSSTTTPTDFTASLVSGAGTEVPSGALSFSSIIPQADGFFIRTASNVIQAEYTGNARYPWKFRPIKGSNKVANYDQIYGQDTLDYQVAIESTGQVKLLNLNARGGGADVAKELSDYLSNTYTQDSFNYALNTFSTAATLDRAKARVYVFANRYICVSCSPSSISPITIYSEIILHDTFLKRWGRLKIEHTHLSTILAIDLRTEVLIAFHAGTGAGKYVYTDIHNTAVIPAGYTRNTMQGVFILGKLQYVRSRFLCLDELDIESTQTSPIIAVGSRNFSVFLLPTIDGKNFIATQTPTVVPSKSVGSLVSYACHTEAKNISIGIKGAFDLVSLDMKFHLGGKW